MASSHQLKTFLFAFFVVVLQASLINSEKTFSCNDHDIKISDKQVEGMKKCGESVGVKSIEEMTPDKIPCFARCMMETSGLTDAEGKPHKENILKDIDAAVPGPNKDAYKKAMEGCIDAHGTKLVASDKTCTSYGPLAMCVTTAFKDICKG